MNINVRNKWKCMFLSFYFMIGFLWSLYLHTYFLDVVRKKLQTINIYTWVDKKKIKSSRKECFKNVLEILTNEKHFPKTISQWGFDYGLFTNLLRITIACDFSPSSFKLKRGILPPLTKYLSYFKNYLSYQAIIFLVN